MGYTTGHAWTKEEEKYLTQHYATASREDLTKFLSLPFNTIKDKAAKLRKKGKRVGERENNVGDHGNKARWENHTKKPLHSEITVTKEFLKCRVCNKKFLQISQSHLNKHNMTMQEYRTRFPRARLKGTKNSQAWGNKGGLASWELQSKHPDIKKRLSKMGVKGIQATLAKHPEKVREGGRKGNIRMREVTADRRTEICSKGGHNATIVVRESKNIYFDDQYFDSQQELAWYKHHKKNGRKVIHHFRVGKKEFDFWFPEENMFHEHHPILAYMDTYVIKDMKQYAKLRRQELDNNGHSDAMLIITEKPPPKK